MGSESEGKIYGVDRRQKLEMLCVRHVFDNLECV